MGKRAKKVVVEGETGLSEGQECKRNKQDLNYKSNNVRTADVSEIELIDNQQLRKKSKKKIHENLLDTNTLKIATEISNQHSTKKCKEASLDKADFLIRNNNEKTKSKSNIDQEPEKPIFVNDEPQEVSTQTSLKASQSKRNFNNEEDEVKEEDIDQFCDEVTEEDNKQFEDWVKLIENKLYAKKAK